MKSIDSLAEARSNFKDLNEYRGAGTYYTFRDGRDPILYVDHKSETLEYKRGRWILTHEYYDKEQDVCIGIHEIADPAVQRALDDELTMPKSWWDAKHKEDEIRGIKDRLAQYAGRRESLRRSIERLLGEIEDAERSIVDLTRQKERDAERMAQLGNR